MALEEELVLLLGPLAGGRVYPDAAPEDATLPFIVYQQVGGTAFWYVENAIPSHRHARVQIGVWATSRQEANGIAHAIERAICESGLVAEPYGAFTAVSEPDMRMYGTRQDFGFQH